MLKGNINYEVITDIIDNKVIKFIRISAQEYVYGKQSRILSQNDITSRGFYNYKMRIVPSIDDLINDAKFKYSSPLMHKSNLFINGFNNFQGELSIDNNLFKYIVRIGKAKNDNIFYDVNLQYKGKIKEIEQTVPNAK